MVRIAFSCSFASALNARKRRANERSASNGRVGLDVPRRVGPQGRGGDEHPGQLLATEPFTDGLGCSDDEAEHLLLGLGGGVDRRAARGQEHRQRLAIPAATWGPQARSGQGFACCPDRVEGIRFRAVTALSPLGSIELDDDLLERFEVSGQAGAVATGTFDRPGPQHGVLAGKLDHLGVALCGGLDGDLAEDTTGAGVDYGC